MNVYSCFPQEINIFLLLNASHRCMYCEHEFRYAEVQSTNIGHNSAKCALERHAQFWTVFKSVLRMCVSELLQ